MSLTTSKNDCIVPCTYPMLKEILSSEEETLNYKGFKVDMVLFCGIVIDLIINLDRQTYHLLKKPERESLTRHLNLKCHGYRCN
jgi:hypothetical protein